MAPIDQQAARFVSGYYGAAVHAALGQIDEPFAAPENKLQSKEVVCTCIDRI